MWRPTAPPCVPARSHTVTRCPTVASRAAAASAPIPEPITTIRAMQTDSIRPGAPDPNRGEREGN
ncbi:hypothetical protein GCM10027168_30260 [Streptomyces capparidis]